MPTITEAVEQCGCVVRYDDHRIAAIIQCTSSIIQMRFQQCDEPHCKETVKVKRDHLGHPLMSYCSADCEYYHRALGYPHRKRTPPCGGSNVTHA